MAICPSNNLELPPIGEVPCFQTDSMERLWFKTKHKVNVKYIGVKASKGDDEFIHSFQLKTGQVLSFVLDHEFIEGVEEGQSMDIEYIS